MVRGTLFFDESGEEKMPKSKISRKDKDRYFIYTAVFGHNYDFENFQRYYIQLKYKYLNKNGQFHSSKFFRESNTKKKIFINTLANFLDTIPFVHITVIVDKKSLFEKGKLITARNPMDTTLRKSLSICIESGFQYGDFIEMPAKEILKNISKYKFPDIYNYYPLEIAYKKILETYFNIVSPALLRTKVYNYKEIKPMLGLCFETSPNRRRILEYTDMFRNMMDGNKKTKLAENIYDSLYDISFPFKKARYLGLELADMIGYGYNLQKNRRLLQVPLYKPLRRVILRRERILREQLGIKTVINM